MFCECETSKGDARFETLTRDHVDQACEMKYPEFERDADSNLCYLELSRETSSIYVCALVRKEVSSIEHDLVSNLCFVPIFVLDK